jgi:hypothetical protein
MVLESGFGIWDLAPAGVIARITLRVSGSRYSWCLSKTARRATKSERTQIYAKIGGVKTTVEIPDPLFRKAKAAAAHKGIPLKQFFTDALSEQLRRHIPGQAPEKPWMQAFGGLRQLQKENKRLERIIATEFESIELEEWH